jgi:hypothetical protein
MKHLLQPQHKQLSYKISASFSHVAQDAPTQQIFQSLREEISHL